MTKFKKQLQAIESLDWQIDQNDNEIEISNYSPAGEQLVEYLNADNIVESCKSIYENYDADEHAEMWIAHRGKDGVPNSITELVNDANKIEQMYYDLYQKVLCA